MKEIIIAVAISLFDPIPKTEVVETKDFIIIVPETTTGELKFADDKKLSIESFGDLKLEE